MRKAHKTSGFSMLELMVVLFIIAILAKIAAATYYSYSLEGRRSDGINALLNLANEEEQYRSNNTSYGTLAQVGGNSTSPQGYYTIAVTASSATGYTITATGISGQANDKQNGTSCSPLTITSSNGTITQTPTACWPS